MVRKIMLALEHRRARVCSDHFIGLARLLWWPAPDLYDRLMTRKFAIGLEQP